MEAFAHQLQKYSAWLQFITHNNPPRQRTYKFMLDWVERMIWIQYDVNGSASCVVHEIFNFTWSSIFECIVRVSSFFFNFVFKIFQISSVFVLHSHIYIHFHNVKKAEKLKSKPPCNMHNFNNSTYLEAANVTKVYCTQLNFSVLRNRSTS